MQVFHHQSSRKPGGFHVHKVFAHLVHHSPTCLYLGFVFAAEKVVAKVGGPHTYTDTDSDADGPPNGYSITHGYEHLSAHEDRHQVADQHQDLDADKNGIAHENKHCYA